MMRLIWSICLLLVSSFFLKAGAVARIPASFVSGLHSSAVDVRTFDYDARDEGSSIYDNAAKGMIAYNAAPMLSEACVQNGNCAVLPNFLVAAKEAPKLLGPGTRFGAKIEGQLAKRGWTKDLVQSTIDNPSRTVPWQDTRHLPGGGTMSEPATAYYSQRGGYVVRNNRTGDIVQVSNRTDPGWKAPWD